MGLRDGKDDNGNETEEKNYKHSNRQGCLKMVEPYCDGFDRS